jgi:hypothetical protein
MVPENKDDLSPCLMSLTVLKSGRRPQSPRGGSNILYWLIVSSPTTVYWLAPVAPLMP